MMENSKNNIPYVDESNVILDKPIGFGKSGNVFRGKVIDPINQKQTIIVAIKELRKNFPKSKSQNQKILFESADIFKLKHENILEILWLCQRTDNVILIIMEYAEGNCLSRFLSGLELPLPFEIFVSWSIQLAKGMDYLHSNNIIHCDLKCKNVLLNKKPVEYLDMIKLKLKIANISNYSLTGTPTHMSPETIKNKFTQKSDVWAFAVCLWEMYYHKIPFYGLETFQIFYKVGIKKETLDISKDCNLCVAKLLKQCWCYNEVERPDFIEIIKILSKLENDLL